jgi:hypothetical protein
MCCCMDQSFYSRNMCNSELHWLQMSINVCYVTVTTMSTTVYTMHYSHSIVKATLYPEFLGMRVSGPTSLLLIGLKHALGGLAVTKMTC